MWNCNFNFSFEVAMSVCLFVCRRHQVHFLKPLLFQHRWHNQIQGLSLVHGRSCSTIESPRKQIIGDTRVPKSCNHAITQLRKIFEKLRKSWTKEQEKKNWHEFHVFVITWVFPVSHVLGHFFSMFLGNILKQSICIAQKKLLLESLADTSA